MLNILLKKSSKVKWMPLFVHNAVLVMAVPTWLNDWAHGLLGANELHPAGTAPY
ncbi:hypothetical protein HMI55_002986 [Coelomomyces lativittatus]|nr:hypothetical protein HMI55_002986 [Coelomomyces lativittatus]